MERMCIYTEVLSSQDAFIPSSVGVYSLLHQRRLCSQDSVVIVDVPVLSSVGVFIALMACGSPVPPHSDLWMEWSLEAQ